MLQIPEAFAVLRVEPVDGTTLVGPDLLQITSGTKLSHRCGRFIAEAPDGIDVVVLRESLTQFHGAARYKVDDAAGEVAGVEDLVEIADKSGAAFAGNRDHGVAHRD